MSDSITTKTSPYELERGNMKVENLGTIGWRIEVGGVNQPRLRCQGLTMEDAIAELVRLTSECAIEDEAREWQANNSANVDEKTVTVFEYNYWTANNPAGVLRLCEQCSKAQWELVTLIRESDGDSFICFFRRPRKE